MITLFNGDLSIHFYLKYMDYWEIWVVEWIFASILEALLLEWNGWFK